jgi:peptide/nickel transport system substrate-binding protein
MIETDGLSRLDRRSLLRAGAAAALVTASGAPLRAQEPRRGGRLRIGVAHGQTSDNLDPHIRNNGFTQELSYGMHNCLTEIAADGSLVPELAESWEASPDAAIWTFRIREGVEFHNGKTLDSADVVASLNYHRGDDSKSEAKVLVDPVTEITAPDARTVRVTLSTGNADFPYLMADHHLIICPAAGDGIDWVSGVGTGPYMLDSFEPGQRCAARRNPNYWKAGRGHFDEVIWTSLLDPAARQNALLTGEVDVIDQVPTTTVALLARNPAARILEVAGMLHYTFPMWTQTPPFDDNNVRMALKLAVDRQQLVDTILRGHGSLGNDHPIPPAHRYYAADLPQREQDLDKARWHVGQWGGGTLSVPLHAADSVFPGAVDAATLIAEQARAAGIEIEVVREPNDGYWANVWKKKPWCLSYWGGRPTEDWMFSSAYLSGASANETALDNARFDEVVLAARAELDEAKRAALYAEAQMLLRDEGGSLIPMFANHIHAVGGIGRPSRRGRWQLAARRASGRRTLVVRLIPKRPRPPAARGTVARPQARASVNPARLSPIEPVRSGSSRMAEIA